MAQAIGADRGDRYWNLVQDTAKKPKTWVLISGIALTVGAICKIQLVALLAIPLLVFSLAAVYSRYSAEKFLVKLEREEKLQDHTIRGVRLLLQLPREGEVNAEDIQEPAHPYELYQQLNNLIDNLKSPEWSVEDLRKDLARVHPRFNRDRNLGHSLFFIFKRFEMNRDNFQRLLDETRERLKEGNWFGY